MQWNWFDLAFPWIGVAAAAVLLALLFGTTLFRSAPSSSRWHDRVWLSWIASVAYLLHNGEEYGLDLLGRRHAFPGELCAAMKLPAYPDCPIPPAFYLAVNITLFWVVAPLAALLARRHALVGLTLYSVVFTNGLIHVLAFLGPGYTPGALTAAVVFLPLSAWVAHACFGNGGLSYKAMAWLIVNGVALHAILIASVFLFKNRTIGSTALVSVQIINASLLLLVPWLGPSSLAGAPP